MPLIQKVIEFKLYLTLLFILMCVVGFVLQVYQVSKVYFKFTTTTRSDFRVLETAYYTTTVFCLHHFDLLNRSKYEKYEVQQAARNKKIQQELLVLTVRDIMELTPQALDIVRSCMIRDQELHLPIFLNSSQCQDFFNITKSVSGEKVCYDFIPLANFNYSVGDVSSSPTYQNVAYKIDLDAKLGRAHYASIISHHPTSSNSDPLISRMFGYNVHNANSFIDSGFLVYEKLIYYEKLPPPYDTKCINRERQVCYELCLINRFKTMNRIPWSGFHRNSVDMKIFSYKDLQDESMALVARKAFQDCHFQCKIQAECRNDFSITLVRQITNSRKILFISSMAPAGPCIKILSVPMLTFVEYLVQMGSCLAIWFGFSIISLDPVKLIHSRRKRKVANFNIRRPLTNTRFVIVKTVLPTPRTYCSCSVCNNKFHNKHS